MALFAPPQAFASPWLCLPTLQILPSLRLWVYPPLPQLCFLPLSLPSPLLPTPINSRVPAAPPPPWPYCPSSPPAHGPAPRYLLPSTSPSPAWGVPAPPCPQPVPRGSLGAAASPLRAACPSSTPRGCRFQGARGVPAWSPSFPRRWVAPLWGFVGLRSCFATRLLLLCGRAAGSFGLGYGGKGDARFLRRSLQHVMETVWAVVWWCEVGKQDVQLGCGAVLVCAVV